MGGAGKLGELFKSAEASSGKSGGGQQQQQQNLGQLFKSAQSQQPTAAAGKTHLSQKNLPNVATVEASPPSQVGKPDPSFIYYLCTVTLSGRAAADETFEPVW